MGRAIERNFFDRVARARINRAHKPPSVLEKLLAPAGVMFNGKRPWDIQVHDALTYRRALARGSLGFGEAYMDGLWDCARLDELFTRLLQADIDRGLRELPRLGILLSKFSASLALLLLNQQNPRRAWQVAEQHYDIGNDIYSAMLDSNMIYSCGYWEEANSLEEAQQHKLDLICRKLQLQPGERLLDIGCGWGGLAQYAATHYGVDVVGVTISQEQYRLARERCEGLPVEFRLMDYRELRGSFDKVVSVGMFEHVGRKNYQTYLDVVRRVMKADGLFLLHTIGSYATSDSLDPWIHKYIFPNGYLPSARQMAGALEPDLVVRDWHEFGQDYDRTLMAWWHNFDRAWPELQEKYGERFYRMWKYYLHCCAGLFRSGQGQLWQVVLSHRGARPEYRSIR